MKEFGKVVHDSYKTKNYQMFNQLKFDPKREENEHQKYLGALADSQDLVQEGQEASTYEQTTQEKVTTEVADPSQGPEVQEAINTVKAILAKKGVPLTADSDPQSIEWILQQAQMVDEGIKDEKKDNKMGSS